MNFVIAGLPATGKTTICKRIAEQTNLKYLNDYEILKLKGFCFKDNTQIMLKDYSKYILEFLNGKDNLILDLQFTLTPHQVKQLGAKGYYLGFADVEPKELFSLMREKDSKLNIATTKLFIKKSKEMQLLCLKEDMPYFKVNKDRTSIIDEVFNEVIACVFA